MRQERFVLLRGTGKPPPRSTLVLAILPLVGTIVVTMLFRDLWPAVIAGLIWCAVLIIAESAQSREHVTPYELRVDPYGLEFGPQNAPTRLPWRHVSRLSVVRTATPDGPRKHLVAWLEAGVDPPETDSTDLPYYDSAIGGLRITDVDLYDATPAEIQWALASYCKTWEAAK